ncbi:ly-6/neurotoxin-like protein 1 [Bombina bombina]|uniref:ly-6/neurotoxin-like protein 1 n=1 Tax=Bombina bombina TaxID=8345 RepID=UPI00235A6602|nr:ly-6/neurotoxin-like protein 1 [Bombina bombina]
MRLILALGVTLGVIAVVSTLTCNICDFRFIGRCWSNSKVDNCMGNCSTTKTMIGSVQLFSSLQCEPNCVPTNGTSKDSIFKLEYTRTCCSTNECNSGTSIKTSLSLGLGLTLLWLFNAL